MLLVRIARFTTRQGHGEASGKIFEQHPAHNSAYVVVNHPCASVLVIANKDSPVLLSEWPRSLDDVAHEKKHANILHPNRASDCPDDWPALDGRRGGNLRADCVENLGSGFLDVLQAGRQELRVTFIELDVVLRR
jgi:hypothetical protein